MGNFKVLTVVVITGIFTVSMMSFTATAASDCIGVKKAASFCIGYVSNLDNSVSDACCHSLKDLQDTIKNTADAVKDCYCYQSVAKPLKGINFTRMDSLAAYCHTSFTYSLHLDYDCSKAKFP
ncbi:Non-specific lipid-transfer protein 3-like protein [Drosera capensis]